MKKLGLGLVILVSVIVSSFFIGDDSNTTIKAISYNGNNLRINIDGETSNTLPTSGTYYLVDYDCSNANTKVTWDNNNYTLDVSNGTKKGGVACYLEFKSKPLLSEMPVGSYVKYVGANGCDGKACEGQNTNYESDTKMGYCYDQKYQFHVNGWRIGYIKDGRAVIVSAGAPECMCTNSDGTTSSSSCGTYLSSTDINKHYDNMDAIALKYCNSKYAKGGVCDKNTSWAMDADDFKAITGSVLSSSSCYAKYSSISCGWTNDLIDNGSYYWLATKYSSNISFYWIPTNRTVYNDASHFANGVRPVLSLESSLIVTGGTGTYTDPYIIGRNYFGINNDSKYINASDNLSSVILSMNTSEESVTNMCISVDTSVCTDYVEFSSSYTLDWANETDGEKIVYVYYKNNNGKIVAAMNESIILDTTAPANNSVSLGFSDGLNGTVTLASTGADYMCLSDTSGNSSDCSDWRDYETSINWSFNDGSGIKTLYVFFKDEAGNISDVVSASMTCTNNCENNKKYFMDVYAGDSTFVFLVRDDGSIFITNLSDAGYWFSATNVVPSLATCAVDTSVEPSSALTWCLGTDNNIYYTAIANVTGGNFVWNKLVGTPYFDVNNFSYSIVPWGNESMFIIRSDGKINGFSDGVIMSESWFGEGAIDIATCSGNVNSTFICMGKNGNYYHLDLENLSYFGGSLIGPSFRNSSNTWIDIYDGANTDIIINDGTNLSIANFAYNSTPNAWVTTSIPGGGLKTCASVAGINLCLAEDNYIYAREGTFWGQLYAVAEE